MRVMMESMSVDRHGAAVAESLRPDSQAGGLLGVGYVGAPTGKGMETSAIQDLSFHWFLFLPSSIQKH